MCESVKKMNMKYIGNRRWGKILKIYESSGFYGMGHKFEKML